jgi:hypothetical protein
LDGRENRVVAATGAPPRHALLEIFDLLVLVMNPQQTTGRGTLQD